MCAGALVSCGVPPGPNSSELRPVSGSMHPALGSYASLRGSVVGPRAGSIRQPLKLASRAPALSGFHFVEVAEESVLPPPFRIPAGDPIPEADPKRQFTERVMVQDQLEIAINDVDVNSPFFQTALAGVRAGFIVGPLEVDQEGILRLPYLRDIRVLGKTLNDVSLEVAEAAREVSPTAEATVRRTARLAQRVFVYGEVTAPGSAVIDREDYGLLEALASSGGPRGAPHLYTFVLHRDGAAFRTNVSSLSEQQVKAQDADVLKVEPDTRLAFHVTGVIGKPGRYPFPEPDSTVLDALTLAQGLVPGNSDARGVFVFRSDGQGGNLVFGIDLTKPNAMFLAQHFSLAPNDVVYVSEAPVAQWQRATRSVLPILGAAAAFATVTR